MGGVAGGASAAARLRRLDENAEIIMFERGDYISFANCGLPYYIGGEITDKSKLTLQTPESFNARFNVDVRIRSEVVSINREEKTVSVRKTDTGETYTESYNKLVLSMGAEPIKPPIKGTDLSEVFVLRNIPDTYAISDFIKEKSPKTAVVVGAGYIGVEMAENLVFAGLEVTLVEMAPQVIAPLDYDMACEVHGYLESKGVKLMLSTSVTGISQTPQGLNVELNSGNITADMLIMAIGVRPESAIAKSAGLDTNPRGGIIVSSSMQTSDADIYAVGDAVEVVDYVTGNNVMVPLAGPANKQGRIAADNICGIASRYTGTQGSAILKVFDLTVATTGINEKTAKQLGKAYDKSFTYSASHAGYYPGATNISIKTIYEKPGGKILGAQLIGFEGTDKRCDVIATAIRFGATAKDLTNLELCYAPPYSSAKDPVNMAGYTIENIVEGKVKNFHWHDVEQVQKDKNALLLDVRTALEFEYGSIDGAVNIPLDELRGRLGEIDKTKKIYILCQIGLRGYVACRILSQYGYNCYNLSGGYRLYHSIYKTGNNGSSPVAFNTETQRMDKTGQQHQVDLDTCGLDCPKPIAKVQEALDTAQSGDTILVSSSNPGIDSDIQKMCNDQGHTFAGASDVKGIIQIRIIKA